ncbi:bifunctional uroporphyrinogen-III synthetase/response regulator domain protein [Arthrobacter crystallopoietes BAB-32]|uniref:Bifunctional uroporphyrinogen-III synthetase/response regulator domain protein n=1 Tax=Arthrobacter crystallopoietes BAB-32 TaxID=1246476 RepID=N1V7U5_9MICC|nr:uroporphyrinogen-III synthase [Arthrobacter crystallopoietes]EMY36084.1 bifunctional uroporphyrinogen-III synthetase/response regulator domain protein [Arthrobacter crystallopoietes BAB-32]
MPGTATRQPADTRESLAEVRARVETPSAEALAGFRIGVTSDRRAEDLVSALERRGAQVMHAPVLRIAPVAEDRALLQDTAAILHARPDITIVTTAYGMRRWSEAADVHGLGEELMETLAASRILVRGPKARGAVRAAGLNDAGISHDERTSSLVDLLLEEGVGGRTIAIQLHGYTDAAQLARLRDAGARVLAVTPYRWVKPDGFEDKVGRLIQAVVAGQLDVVTFTSAPAVDALLSTAHELGQHGALVEAFRNDVVAAAVGPVTARPLEEAGIRPIMPERYRLGALIRLVVEHLSGNRIQRVPTALGEVQIRGRSVILGGQRADLSPTPMALFRALATAGGAVLPRESLQQCLPDSPGDHALDMAMSRLRQTLPDASLITTVIKRGYRLNV